MFKYVLGLLVLLLAGFFLYSQNHPLYSLAKIAHAIQDKDFAEVSRYVDITSLSASIILEMTKEGSEQLPGIGKMIPEKDESFRPFLNSMVESYLNKVFRGEERFFPVAKWTWSELVFFDFKIRMASFLFPAQKIGEINKSVSMSLRDLFLLPYKGTFVFEYQKDRWRWIEMKLAGESQ